MIGYILASFSLFWLGYATRALIEEYHREHKDDPSNEK